MVDQLRKRLKGFDRQTAVIGLIVLLVVGAPVAYAATGLFTAGSTFQTDSGLSVQVQQDQSLSGNPFTDANTYQGDGGTVTAESDGNGYIEVQQWGSSSNDAIVSNISLRNTAATIDPDSSDVNSLTIGGAADEIRWRDIGVDDTEIDVTINGASDLVNVTVHGLTSGKTYRMDAGDAALESENRIATAENKEATFTLSDGSYRMSAFENSPPTVDNLAPDGEIVSESATLAADINDDTFSEGSVNVTFRVGGDIVHETDVSTSQRVNYTLTQGELPASGEHTWSVTATDALDASQTENAAFSIPGEIVVRNVSDASDSIPDATATAYTEERQIELDSNSIGVISLDELPAEQDITLVINAEGYHERTTVLPTIVQSEDAYLIPKNNTTTVENRFTLNDPTGEFDSDSLVQIERPIIQPNESRWRQVAGDQFGVEGFQATLVEGKRYRIRIVSDDGDVAQMGKFTAEQTEEVPLRPQSPAVSIGEDESIGYSANVTDAGDLKIQYLDPTNSTSVISVQAVSRYNDSDILLAEETFYDANALMLSEPVGEVSDGYVVILEGQRDGESFTIRQPIGPDQISLVPGGLSQVWLQIASIGLLMMVGGVFSRLNVGIGAITTSMLGGIMWYVGLMDGVATWASVAVAITFSVVYTMVTQR